MKLRQSDDGRPKSNASLEEQVSKIREIIQEIRDDGHKKRGADEVSVTKAVGMARISNARSSNVTSNIASTPADSDDFRQQLEKVKRTTQGIDVATVELNKRT